MVFRVRDNAFRTSINTQSEFAHSGVAPAAAVSRYIDSKEETKKATPRFAYWIAPRSEKQCADNFLQAKRRANEVRFILRSSIRGKFAICTASMCERTLQARNGLPNAHHQICGRPLSDTLRLVQRDEFQTRVGSAPPQNGILQNVTNRPAQNKIVDPPWGT